MKKIVALLLITASTSSIMCGLSYDKESSPEPTTHQRDLSHVHKKITQSVQKTILLVSILRTINVSYQAALNQINGTAATIPVPAPTRTTSTQQSFTAQQIMQCMQDLGKNVVTSDDLERYYAHSNDLEGAFSRINLNEKR